MSSSLYGVGVGGCEFRFFFPHGKNTFFIRFQLLLWAIIYSKQNYTSKEILANHLSNPAIPVYSWRSFNVCGAKCRFAVPSIQFGRVQIHFKSESAICGFFESYCCRSAVLIIIKINASQTICEST